MRNPYLILAYAFVWAIFLLYSWSLTRRQSRLGKELEELRRRAQGQSPKPSPSA